MFTRFLWYTLTFFGLYFAAPTDIPDQKTATVKAFLTAQNAQNKAQIIVPKDTAVLHFLEKKMAEHRASAAPEKLYLHTDRSLYEPGETLWFAAYLRDAGSLDAAEKSQILYVELQNPQGQMVQEKTILALDGMASGQFDFGRNLPGGLYKIRAYSAWMQNDSSYFEKEITLQKAVLPNLNMKLEFMRKAYGAGDEAVARFDALSLENQPLTKKELLLSASVDGQSIFEGKAQTDDAGRAYLRFKLPATLESNDGLLNVRLDYAGQTEAISRPIPIVLNRLDVQFFPEGGDAVVGLPCRMAFKAVNEHGKPADVSGQIVDAAGAEVARFSSFHQGMGAFDFTPKAGESYFAKIEKPFACAEHFPLPEAQAAGAVMRVLDNKKTGVSLAIQNKNKEKLHLIATFGDKSVYFQSLPIGSESVKLTVPTAGLGMGILRLTLFESGFQKAVAIAERLVFINRHKELQIEAKTNKEKYLPREQVDMEITVKDHEGRPVSGAFSMAVVDDTQLTFADDKQGNLLASLLLEQDLKGNIEEPNFYFDKTEEKAEQALDFLLLTQGWRRFVWKEMLENELRPPQFLGETATLGGQLFDAKKNRPMANRTLTLEPNGPSCQSDAKGYFSFKNIDIERYTHIKNKNGEMHPISWDYSDSLFLFEPLDFEMPVKVRKRTPTNGYTTLTGRVMDSDFEGEGLIGATIKVMQGRELVGGTVSDFDGLYRLNVEPGTYTIEISYTGMATKRIDGVQVLSNRNNQLDPVEMSASELLNEVAIVAYSVPLIQKDQTTSGQTLSMDRRNAPARGNARNRKRVQEQKEAAELTAEQIRNLPTRNVNQIVASTAGTQSGDAAALNIKGRRSNATNYYVDGIRVDANAVQVQDMDALPMYLNNNDSEDEDLEAKTVREMDLRAAKPTPKQPFFGWKNADIEKQKRHYAPFLHHEKRFDRAREFYVPKYGEKNQGQSPKKSDMRPTIYWNPSVKTDAEGKAKVSFFASDAITNFRTTIEGIGEKGQLGRSESRFFVQKPLSLMAKMPHSVVSGDTLEVHLVLTNKTGQAVQGQVFTELPAHFSLTNALQEQVEIAAISEVKIKLRYAIGHTENHTELPLSFSFKVPDAYEDIFTADIRTLDKGFPVRQVFSDNAAQRAFSPKLMDPVEGSVQMHLNIYPNTLDEVLSGMERMLRQPNGCFEQVSSSNYPNLLVLDLLRKSGRSAPETEERALQLLADGYSKLAGYECADGGFDWWAKGAAHEGLTAYGIIQFYDMAKVYDKVDKTMNDRAVKWLLSRRDGKGGWLRRDDWHGWQSDGVLDAYLAWTLSEAGYASAIKPEIEAAYQKAEKSEDVYQMALLANAFLVEKDARTQGILQKILKKQAKDGSFEGKSHSVMHGHGNSFTIETTALVALALMNNGTNGAELSGAMDYLSKSKTQYGYGSTQATVMALKAICAYAEKLDMERRSGTLVVQVNGKRIHEEAVSSNQVQPVSMAHLEKYVVENEWENPFIEVFFEGMDKGIPYDLEISYASRRPDSKTGAVFDFSTKLNKNSVQIGETVQLKAEMVNTSDQILATPMMIVGIPAGLSLQPWQLKKMQDEGQFDYFELWDGNAVFHFEKLDVNASHSLSLHLRADITGDFEAPASRAFLYYDNEQRIWAKPERIVVK